MYEKRRKEKRKTEPAVEEGSWIDVGVDVCEVALGWDRLPRRWFAKYSQVPLVNEEDNRARASRFGALDFACTV